MTEPISARRSAWRRFTAWLAFAIDALMSLSVLILIIPVSLQIFSRFTDLIPAYIWTEEAARFLFIWIIMLGAQLGVREASHFNIDVFPRLTARGSAVLNLISSVFILVLALVFVRYGYEFTVFAIHRISELAELPLWMIHIAWPLTGLVWIVFLGEQFVDNLRVLRDGRKPA